VATLFLPAICCSGVIAGVTLAANKFVLVKLARKNNQRRFNNTSTKTKDEVQGGLFLDVVVSQGATVFQLLASEDKSLLIRGNSFLVLDLLLHVFDGIGAFNLEGNCLAGEGLDEDLHTSTKTEDEMESRLLLDVVVREGAAVLKLLASEDETLLIRWDANLREDPDGKDDHVRSRVVRHY